jgi:hypothetical protein
MAAPPPPPPRFGGPLNPVHNVGNVGQGRQAASSGRRVPGLATTLANTFNAVKPFGPLTEKNEGMRGRLVAAQASEASRANSRNARTAANAERYRAKVQALLEACCGATKIDSAIFVAKRAMAFEQVYHKDFAEYHDANGVPTKIVNQESAPPPELLMCDPAEPWAKFFKTYPCKNTSRASSRASSGASSKGGKRSTRRSKKSKRSTRRRAY